MFNNNNLDIYLNFVNIPLISACGSGWCIFAPPLLCCAEVGEESEPEAEPEVEAQLKPEPEPETELEPSLQSSAGVSDTPVSS